MAEKKRKVADSNAAQPSKKSKKSVKIAPEPTIVTKDIETIVEPVATTEDSSAKPTRKTRKRAADFLYDEPEADVPKPKKGKQETKSLTADGINGVVEKSDDEGVTITTSKKPGSKSMMAEAERTQDAELADEYGSDNGSETEDIDTAPALLTGFDSDNEDTAEDKNFDASRVAPIPQFKKTSKKLRQAKESKSDGPGVVYVGRIPHGFYESQMREYFSQFGTITRLRLSRNKKTGASKHFAFIEFESDQVAKIVADTMDNYLMFGHILKCKYAPAENLHAEVWKGANKKYRKIPQHKLLKQQAEKPKTEEQIRKKMGKVQSKREKKSKLLKEMGYEYDLPTLVKPDMAKIAAKSTEDKLLAIEDKVEGALVPPPTVPKDEVAVMVEEKRKKERKVNKTKKEGVQVSEEATEGTTPVVTEGAVATTKELPAKKSKKSKKTEIAPESVLTNTETVMAAEEPSKKESKKSRKEATVESVPTVSEEASIAVQEPASKKVKKAKKGIAIEDAPAVVETVAVAVEEVPQPVKKNKKGTRAANDSKSEKQLKSILKKSSTA